MVSIQSLLVLAALTAPGDTVLLDFTSATCGPCKMMEPTLHRLASAGYPVRQIDVAQQPQLASQFAVRGVPCFVLVSGGREVDRVVGATSYSRLEQMFQLARFSPAGGNAPPQGAVRLQSPDAHSPGQQRGMAAGQGPISQAPPVMAGDRFGDTSLASRDQPIPWSNHAAGNSQGGKHGVAQATYNAPPAQPSGGNYSLGRQRLTAQQRAMPASVRLRVEDPGGHSYGSGTIIDVHGDEALVMTCAHIFRDSDGKGKILVDLFLPGGHRGVTGTLIRYDMKRDVALVSIRPGTPIEPMRMVGADYQPSIGERVFSVGCDRGGLPSLQESRLIGINRLLGPPNLHVAGRPVDGRSGGGLFTADGRLIGVCNFADPGDENDASDDAGIFAAYGSLHDLLDRAGLSFVYRGEEPAAGMGGAQLASQRAPAGDFAAVPQFGKRPAGSDGQTASQPGNLTPDEQAVLERISGQAEVICIVKHPQRGSRIVALETPSSAFFEQLTAESQRQAGRQATTLHLGNHASQTQPSDSWRTPSHR